MRLKIFCAPLTLLALHSSLSFAAPAAGSAYFTDVQNSHVEDATSKGVGQVNMITCILGALKPDALVNQGNYVALVDEDKCSAKDSSTSTSPTANYTTAIVNSSRASNDDPMIVKVWLNESDEGQQSTIFVHVAATEAPSDANPYGVFRLDFCGTDGSGTCRDQGFLEGATSGIRYFQIEHSDHTSTVAMRLSTSGISGGNGSMSLDEGNSNLTFNFAYDPTLFLRSDTASGNSLCFSRDASDPDTGLSVWRYGLYDAVTGDRVALDSGFPIEYTAGGKTYNGFLGYYGLSLPSDALATLQSGSTVSKVDYGTGSTAVKTAYTVVHAGGKLTKYTKRTRTLHDMDGIKFTTFVGSDGTGLFAGAQANTQYELYWDDAAHDFKATAQMNCSQNGCQSQDLGLPAPDVSVAYWVNKGGVSGNSQSLGGDVFIQLQDAASVSDSHAVNVIYRTQDLVYASQLPATLFCVNNCPTSGTLSGYFASNSTDDSPYTSASYNNYNPTLAANVAGYTGDTTHATLLDSGNQSVVFTDADAFSNHSQYQGGVRSGRLFEHLGDAECSPGSNTYCDYKVNDLEVYYQWETGPNSNNQFAAVKDSQGTYVTFDAPLQATYTVPSGHAYGDYANKSIVLQYGGFGDLWGIPGYCVSSLTNAQAPCDNSDESRYVPAFVIPYDTTLGKVDSNGTPYLVKWLDREIRFASKNPSVCASDGLTLAGVGAVALPTVGDLQNPADSTTAVFIGAEPTVTDAPRVIQGDVKY